MLSLAACGGENKASGESGKQEAISAQTEETSEDNSNTGNKTEDTNSDTSGESENTASSKEDEEALIWENFTGDTLVNNTTGIEVKFEISSIEKNENGIAFYYDISRNSSGYTNIYRMLGVRLNGCYISPAYYAGNAMQDEMGKNKTGQDHLKLYFLFPTEKLVQFGIEDFRSLDFTLAVGYTAGASAEYQYTQKFEFYADEKHEINHQLTPSENHIQLVNNDICEIVLVETEWREGSDESSPEGQEYHIYCRVNGKEDIQIIFDKLVIGNVEVQPNEYAVSRRKSTSVWLNGETAYMLAAYWTQAGQNVSELPLESAVFYLTIEHSDGKGGYVKDSVEVPVDLSMPMA